MKVTIGIDMGGTNIKIGLISQGRVIATTKIAARAQTSLQKRLYELEDPIDILLRKNRAVPDGIGIAFPDIVDTVQMKILTKYIKYPDAKNVDLKNWAMKKWGIPLVLENDARAALVGEWQYGSGKGSENLIMITLGTGVGSAALINGKLLRGTHFIAGILGGHQILNYDGDKCNCGNTGCLESEASSWSLNYNVKKSTEYHESLLSKENELNFHVLFKLADKGDLLALKIRDKCIKAWSLGIINLIYAYDPEKVIIGGGIMKSKDKIIPEINKVVNKDVWIENGSIEIIVAEQFDNAGILGMNYLVNEAKKK